MDVPESIVYNEFDKFVFKGKHMKYLKFILLKFKYFIKSSISILSPFLFFFGLILLSMFAEGYTWEDFGLDSFSLNPNDYCNLTDVDYTYSEDFAESVSFYLINTKSFEKKYPARADYIKELLEN